MSAEIIDMVREFCPAARLIGKRYEGAPNWVEWWENGWFETLDEARAYSANLTVYYDRAPDQGGKIRVVRAD